MGKHQVIKTQNIGDDIWDSDIIAEFDTLEEAEAYCESKGWEYKDDDDVWWDLTISDYLED